MADAPGHRSWRATTNEPAASTLRGLRRPAVVSPPAGVPEGAGDQWLQPQLPVVVPQVLQLSQQSQAPLQPIRLANSRFSQPHFLEEQQSLGQHSVGGQQGVQLGWQLGWPRCGPAGLHSSTHPGTLRHLVTGTSWHTVTGTFLHTVVGTHSLTVYGTLCVTVYGTMLQTV